uniref:Uncharacterized protein n=1 Tax=Mustela putorius furo TaxID=9669 RepID=M3Z3E4_MUSPF
MKFSWLTVTGASMDEKHKCIVNHESDRRKIDQGIPFPSIYKGTKVVMKSFGSSSADPLSLFNIKKLLGSDL